MNSEKLEKNLEGIRLLLSHLHTEVTTLEAQYEQVMATLQTVSDQASLDDLTGLFRRNAFFKKWESVLKECESLNESCGVILIDIDHFKNVNDQYGHQTGDEVIRGVANLLKQYQSPNCFSSRYGGEEFAIVVRGDSSEVVGLAESVRRRAEQLTGHVIGDDGKPNLNDQKWNATVSAGVAVSTQKGFDSKKLLKLADDALYEAKKSGRNRVIKG